MTPRLIGVVAARLATRVLALVAAVAVLLLLLRAAPGDAVDLITTDDTLRGRLSDAWDLHAPLPVALMRALTGDWGTSWTVRPGRPVAELIRASGWSSVPVLLGAFLVMVGGGLFLGSRTRARASEWPKASVLPVFLLGWGCILALNETAFSAMQADLIPRPSWFSLPDTPSALRSGLAVVVLALGSGNLHAFAQGVSEQLAELRVSPAIETLTARGMPTRAVLWRLMLPDLLLLAAERTAFLFGGLVVLERVFAMPGLGSLFFEACVQRDQPVVLASGIVAATGVVGVRALADTARMAVDPRLRDRQ
jgi:peptide/nickel transport system permease protein